MSTALPHVDEHSIEIEAPRELVWTALEHHASTSLRFGPRSPLATLLGTEPRAGFEVAARDIEQRLSLVGRHRFARYRLTFTLADVGDGATRLTARTDAAFPGIHGRIYRLLVIGTGGHALATRRILVSIRRRSVELANPRSGVTS